jgi:DNA-directed RNA polymerase subunit F
MWRERNVSGENPNSKETPVTIAEVKDILEKLKKKTADHELNYTQDVTLKYAQKFARLPAKKGKKLVKTLTKKPFNLDLTTATQIANILPKTEEELSLFFARGSYEISEENRKAMIDLIISYTSTES